MGPLLSFSNLTPFQLICGALDLFIVLPVISPGMFPFPIISLPSIFPRVHLYKYLLSPFKLACFFLLHKITWVSWIYECDQHSFDCVKPGMTFAGGR